MIALNIILIFFCLPETRYTRSPMSIRGQEWHTDEFGVTRVVSQGQDTLVNPGSQSGGTLTQKRTYMQGLNPFSPVAPNGFKLGFGVVVKMLSALSSPAVIWAILASSISLGKNLIHLTRPSRTCD
jgi:hypothetical protein